MISMSLLPQNRMLRLSKEGVGRRGASKEGLPSAAGGLSTLLAPGALQVCHVDRICCAGCLRFEPYSVTGKIR